MSLIKKLEKRFREEKILFANVLVNEKPTPLTLEYEPDRITLNNPGEDFPPFIRIWRDTRKIEASADKVEWSRSEEIEKELQLYLILDPAFLLPHVFGERTVETKVGIMIDGFYNVDELGFPSLLAGYFKEEGNIRRWIRLFSVGEYLLSMSQQDFPPYNDTVTLLFKNISPYLYPIFYFSKRPS